MLNPRYALLTIINTESYLFWLVAKYLITLKIKNTNKYRCTCL